MVLGDLMEKGFRAGSCCPTATLPFFTRPISAVIWITIVVVILFKIPVMGRMLGRPHVVGQRLARLDRNMTAGRYLHLIVSEPRNVEAIVSASS
jgi:hypothetical protein